MLKDERKSFHASTPNPTKPEVTIAYYFSFIVPESFPVHTSILMLVGNSGGLRKEGIHIQGSNKQLKSNFRDVIKMVA